MNTLPSPMTLVPNSSYETTRFNALRDGVLSRHTVLPWEDRSEYQTLLDALVEEHAPDGPTEEHLVEELAGIIWRKRRQRMAEAAVYREKLRHDDALGLRPAFRDMGKRLAAEGYTVIVPNPFYPTRKAPVLSGPFDFGKPEDRAKLVELTAPLNNETKTRDAMTYIAYLDALPQVKAASKIGVVGYCMGGAYTILAAAASPARVGAGVSLHGGNLVTDKPDSPHLLNPRIKASYYFGVATNDDQRQLDAKDRSAF